MLWRTGLLFFPFFFFLLLITPRSHKHLVSYYSSSLALGVHRPRMVGFMRASEFLSDLAFLCSPSGCTPHPSFEHCIMISNGAPSTSARKAFIAFRVMENFVDPTSRGGLPSVMCHSTGLAVCLFRR